MPQTSKRQSFFNRNQYSQTFICEGDSVNTIITEGGAIIEFSRSQFPSSITDPIEVVVAEVYDKSDMIFWKLSTNTSEGQYLESEGMLNVQFYSDDKRIQLNPGEKLSIKLPRSESRYEYTVYTGSSKRDVIQWDLSDIVRNDTFIYYTAREALLDYGIAGYTSTKYFISSNDTIYKNTEEFYPDDYQIDVAEDTISTIPQFRESIYFMFNISELDWINIDKLMRVDSTSTLLVKSDTSLQQEHFLIFRNRNSVISSFGERNPVFENLPLHEDLELISIAERDDTLMYSHIEFKLDSLIELNAKYLPITEAELKLLIEGVGKKRS